MPLRNPLTKGLSSTILRVRIPLFLVLLLGTFVVTSVGWYITTQNQLGRYLERSRTVRTDFVRQVVQLEAESVAKYVLDMSYWDDLIQYLKVPNADWANNNVLPSLEGYHLDGMWAFRKDGTLVLRSFRSPSRTIPASFTPDFEHLSRSRVVAWHERIGADIWEFHGTTIHRSHDVQHKGPYFGYFLVGRCLGPAYLASLDQRLEGKMSLGETPQSAAPHPDHIVVAIPLENLDGVPAAYLRSEFVPNLLILLRSSVERAMFLVLGFAVLMGSLLGYFLLLWIGRPLRVLSTALRSRDQEALQPLLKEQSEFGDIAWLMHQFFEQERSLTQARDELEQRVIERTEALAHQAYHDGLTGLANRVLFRERLEATVALPLNEGKRAAVFFLDMDNFKLINDSLGHEAGDQVLCLTAARLQHEVRSNDTVARLSGDEFAILLIDTDPASVVEVAERIHSAFQEPLRVQEKGLFVSLSMGIAIQAPQDTATDLLRNSDTAMYHAKLHGKGGIALFDQSMQQDAALRLEREAALRHALQESSSEFSLVYQPIFDLAQGHPLEVEALVRWNHPTLGQVPPSEFIPIAEEAGLLPLLGKLVLSQACTCLAQVNRKRSQPLRLNVNLSVRQLQEPEVVQDILTILEQSQLDPTYLVLEVTESVMLQYPELTSSRLAELRRQGIQIAIDDFGTGYSSLSSLAQLPIDTLKIDRSFVAQLEHNRDAILIVQAIIELARALKLSIVAEGIETRAQWDQLLALGCDLGQGYHYSRPLTETGLEAFLLAREGLPQAA